MNSNGWISVKQRQRTLKKEEIFITPIKINPLDLQSLIQARLVRDLSQEEADSLCGFPRNTFKNIDSNRYIPDESEIEQIQNIFHVEIKIQNK